MSLHHPYTISNNLNDSLDESDSTHLAMFLPQRRDVSELAACGPNGLGLGHPLTGISLGEQTQMRLYLVVELSVCSSISEQSPKSRSEGAQIMDHLYS